MILQSILSFIYNTLNEFNNRRAQTLDSNYLMTLKLPLNRESITILSLYRRRSCGRQYKALLYGSNTRGADQTLLVRRMFD